MHCCTRIVRVVTKIGHCTDVRGPSRWQKFCPISFLKKWKRKKKLPEVSDQRSCWDKLWKLGLCFLSRCIIIYNYINNINSLLLVSWPVCVLHRYKGKSYRATVEIVRTADQVADFCRKTCIKLECCPNLFGPRMVLERCSENCSVLTKTKYSEHHLSHFLYHVYISSLFWYYWLAE